jgi:hypothetical protein
MLKNKPHSEFPAGDPHQDYVLNVLAQADFSHAARQRSQLRARLLQKAGKYRGKQNRSLRLVLEMVGLVILVLGFLIVMTRLLDNYSSIPAVVLPASATANSTFTPTPQPLTPTQPGGIDMSSSQDTVRLAISQPTWKTLWGEIELDEYPALGDTSQPEKRLFSQAWLEQSGRGLVLSTGEIPSSNKSNFNLDFGVSQVLLLDRTNLIQYDLPSGVTKTTSLQTMNYPINPLATISPTLDLVYPGFLAILSSEPRLLRMEMAAGRPAVVADWGNSRLWIDTQTGLLLRAERYTGPVGGSSLQSLFIMRQVLVDLPLDDSIFHPQYLNELHFVPPPDQTLPGPTPTPFAGFSPQGWVYFQAAAQAPLEWKVYLLPAGCLVDSTACPDPQLLQGNPDLQINSLYWAPDHSWALFSDTNHNQIVAFDPKNRQWSRPLQGFFQSQLSWSADSRQVAALTEGVDAYDMRLVLIQPDGWIVNNVPTTLKGEKQVLGWLDDHTLAVTVPDVVFKGQAPAWAAADFHPGTYRIDVTTGQTGPLPVADTTHFGLNLSPDGQWILSQEYSAGNNNLSQTDNLSIVHPDGSGIKKVLSTTANIQTSWSPDSRYLLISKEANNPVSSRMLSIFNVESGTFVEISLPSLTNSTAFDLLGWQP